MYSQKSPKHAKCMSCGWSPRNIICLCFVKDTVWNYKATCSNHYLRLSRSLKVGMSFGNRVACDKITILTRSIKAYI